MSQIICGPLPLIAALGVTVLRMTLDTTEHYIHQDPKAWPSHSTIYYAFLGAPKDWQRELVENAITEYTRHANVRVSPIDTSKDKTKSADIRISFATTDGTWSAIGTDALKMDQEGATMNLAFAAAEPSSENRDLMYGIVLHEFGHAFGLAHEWDPSWAQFSSNRRNSRPLVQHIGAYGNGSTGQPTSNFQKPDKTSIMTFFVPQNYTDGNPVVLEGSLSDNDKKWLNLIYPGKADGASKATGILESLNVLNVPLENSSRILLGSTVSEIRFHYHEYISEKWGDRLSKYAIKTALVGFNAATSVDDLEPESHVLQGKVTGITPSIDHNSEDDLYDAVAAAVLNPQFSQVLANVVNQNDDGGSGTQNAIRSPILSGISPQAPPDVQNFIGPLISILGGVLGPLIFSGLPTGAASGIYPQALPPNVEQGIFNVLTKFLKNPVFLGVVRDVASDMIGKDDSAKE
ncbi:hypothetical protein HD554DRAFT_2055531 [Boletus coccyginus]|nr:hypothetical protein HD554DRAFT_2055531 [Boletus coccyginus]